MTIFVLPGIVSISLLVLLVSQKEVGWGKATLFGASTLIMLAGLFVGLLSVVLHGMG